MAPGDESAPSIRFTRCCLLLELELPFSGSTLLARQWPVCLAIIFATHTTTSPPLNTAVTHPSPSRHPADTHPHPSENPAATQPKPAPAENGWVSGGFRLCCPWEAAAGRLGCDCGSGGLRCADVNSRTRGPNRAVFSAIRGRRAPLAWSTAARKKAMTYCGITV